MRDKPSDARIGKIRNRARTSKFARPTWTDVGVLLAEIERLRAALQRIRKVNSLDWIGDADEMPQLIAKAALEKRGAS